MDPIEQLASYFKQFPGIGERQSKRFVYFLMTRNKDYLNDLSITISNLKKNISECIACHRLFPSNGNTLCDYCRDPKHETNTLMIVEKDADYETVRRSKIYNGQYFVLGGLVPVVEKNTHVTIRLPELIDRIVNDVEKKGLTEIVLALSLNPQGEHTDLYLREKLRNIEAKYKLKISSLGRGLSTGTELEYSDSDTIKNAFKNRA